MAPRHLLSSDELNRYFARIGYTRGRQPTLDTLVAVHRAHLLAIPYENLDIHLGRPITLDSDAMFRKLVDEKRGGWCFEMNGVLGRVLETLGFDVRYVSGAVARATRGWRAQGNHLVLIVTLDRRWIADVGFGDGFLTPLPLEVGNYRQGFLQYRVTRDGPWWRVHNHEHGGADGFDFTLTPRAPDSFSASCHELQTAPDSSFVQTTVVERMVPDGIVMLRGATLRHLTAAGVTEQVVQDGTEYVRLLEERFGLALPRAAALWPRIQARHVQWAAGGASG